ncbi:MAG: AmmeMemoRadiSam system protein B [Planctomycetota bacterium]|jgi:AmmeMemoRadiSam system protein B/AmmeMemoRadiSam system protein A
MPRRFALALAGSALALAACEPPPAEETGERSVVDPDAAAKCPYSGETGTGTVGEAAAGAKEEAEAPAAPAGPTSGDETPGPAHRAGPTSGDETPGPVREATAAGPKNFYTSDPQELRKQVSGYIAAARKVKLPGRVIAIVAPHAGYGFSGPAAGWAYKQLEGEDIETVVVIGGHAGGLTAGAVWPGGGWKTPLGSVPVDADLARSLAGQRVNDGAAAALDTRAHLAPIMSGRPDHALEVQVPFIQVALPRAKIVPVYFNTNDAALAARLGEALARAMKGRKAAIVASTDLSHYPDADTAAVVDRAILGAIASLDTKRIVEADRRLMATYGDKNLSCTVCAKGGVIAAVEAAKRLGAKGARTIAYDHSGNRMQKNRSRVVGYGALAVFGAPAPVATPARPTPAVPRAAAAPRPPGRMFTDAEHAMLLSLARKSVELAFEGKDIPKVAGLPPALERKAAAFVTITNKGALRGCMGTFNRSRPVWEVVADRARAAAFRDPRTGLGNVTKEELAQVEIEISVLSDPRKLDDPLSIVLGRDGILLQSADGLKGGTYLPQVGKGFKTKEEFLSHCCANKVGLPAEAWRDPKQVTVFAYTAEVFSEAELRAKVGEAGKAGR